MTPPPSDPAPAPAGRTDQVPPEPEPPVERAFEDLREQITDRVSRGELEPALALCERAVALARDAGLVDSADLALCIRAAVLVARGDGQGEIGRLRRILMGSTSSHNRFAAAYTVSQYHDGQNETEKSLFYAKQALRYAEENGDRMILGRALNRLANLLILSSYFDEAADHYRRALELQGAEDGVDRAILHSNLGYCHTVLGRLRLGLQHLIASLRMLRRLRAEGWNHLPHLGLAYACLELGRLPSARRHALRALRLAEEHQAYDPHVKNALYLLGEAEKQLGDDVSAYERFLELQRRFYPGEPFVVDVLMATDIRKMIHLMA